MKTSWASAFADTEYERVSEVDKRPTLSAQVLAAFAKGIALVGDQDLRKEMKADTFGVCTRYEIWRNLCPMLYLDIFVQRQSTYIFI